jgi:choline-sulfatase
MVPSVAQARTAEGIVKRPNIIYICSDQHSGQLLMGGPGRSVPVRTPNLERLAAKGVCFRNAYCGSPLCAPGRASMATGRFASDVGSYGNTTVFEGGVPTWGNYLRDAGYFCWATGKMDLTSAVDLGFDQVETSHEHFIKPDITELFRRPTCYRIDERRLVNGQAGDRGKADEERFARGLAFIEKQSATGKAPWAAYIGVVAPHPPFIAPQKYLDLYPTDEIHLPNIPPGSLENQHLVYQILRNFSLQSTPVSEERIRSARAAYYAMITELDDHLGTIIDALEQRGILKDTVLIYTSDHGEMHGDHGLWLKRALYEGAARVPMIMAGAGLPEGKVIDTPVSDVDLTATMLDLGGVPQPAGIRGRSLLPLINGDSNAAPPQVYCECHTEGNCTGSFMIRKGDWKYLYFSFYGNNHLFNLRDDPDELNNLAGRPETASVEHELYETLTSLVDPDAVTLRAFEKVEQVLASMVNKNDAHGFYEILGGRLGQGQAALLAQRYYPKWKPANLEITKPFVKGAMKGSRWVGGKVNQ